jgi:hypothetical protein
MTLNYLSPPGEEVSLQFARQGDNIVHISEVSKGLACNCICEECDSKLIARKGKVRQHHFAHHEKSDCKGAWETLTHEKAKEVIIEEGYINVPKPDSIDLVPVHFETVEPEVSIGSYRADVVGTHKSGKRLVIEIAVTHSCEWKKIQYFEEEKISSIEIYMNDLHSVLSLEEFKEYVLSSAQRIWIFNEKHANGQKEYEETEENTDDEDTDISLDHVIEKWDYLISKVEENGTALSTFLSHGKPTTLEGKKLVITIPRKYRFQTDVLKKNSQWIEIIFEKELGVNLRMNFIVGAEKYAD